MAQATPIIFIHGLFAILARPQAPHTPSVSQFLSPNPVSIPDLPGYGTKRHSPPEAVSIDAAADFISAHLHELGYDRAHLVGHSIGGVVAVVVASRSPEAVASIVSVEGNFTLKDAFWSQQLARMERSEVDALLASYRTDPRAWLAGAGVDATAEQGELAVHSLQAQPSSTLQAMARSVVETTAEASYLQEIATILDRSIPLEKLGSVLDGPNLAQVIVPHVVPLMHASACSSFAGTWTIIANREKISRLTQAFPLRKLSVHLIERNELEHVVPRQGKECLCQVFCR
jgi:lipase